MQHRVGAGRGFGAVPVGNPLSMKPHTLRTLAAVFGAGAMVGTGVLGVSTSGDPLAPLGPPPTLVVAPGTGEMTGSGDAAGTDTAAVTTSTIMSFRPTVTASIPPPPD